MKIFAYGAVAAGLFALAACNGSATGDATPDYFFTSIGQGCGNCSAEEITVFSGQTIVFDQVIHFRNEFRFRMRPL